MTDEKKCLNCKHADFKTPHKSGISGWAFCLKNEIVKAHWYPRNKVCDKGRFVIAEPEVIERRKTFFEKKRIKS